MTLLQLKGSAVPTGLTRVTALGAALIFATGCSGPSASQTAGASEGHAATLQTDGASLGTGTQEPASPSSRFGDTLQDALSGGRAGVADPPGLRAPDRSRSRGLSGWPQPEPVQFSSDAPATAVCRYDFGADRSRGQVRLELRASLYPMGAERGRAEVGAQQPRHGRRRRELLLRAQSGVLEVRSSVPGSGGGHSIQWRELWTPRSTSA